MGLWDFIIKDIGAGVYMGEGKGAGFGIVQSRTLQGLPRGHLLQSP